MAPKHDAASGDAEVVLDAKAIETCLEAMAAALAKEKGPLALVGIRRGGAPLAARLAEKLTAKLSKPPVVGSVDVTLYRDDGYSAADWPAVGVTKIPSDLPGSTIVLVDDVLYTGRTVRAALDAILDYGRPHAVRLAVLIDRGQRELPIAADVVGKTLQCSANEHIEVYVGEKAGTDDRVLKRSGPQKERQS